MVCDTILQNMNYDICDTRLPEYLFNYAMLKVCIFVHPFENLIHDYDL